MNDFFRRLERFVVNLIVVALIVLISFQILMKNETAYQQIKGFEFAVRDFLGWEQPTITVSEFASIEKEQEGIITIDLLQDISLPQVWLVKNGERVENFARGIIQLRVKENDYLMIDTRFYSQPLWFEITSLSPSIKTWQKGQQFRVKREELRLGMVQFYNKL